MKTESRVFVISGGFLAGAGLVYYATSRERAGAAMLVLGAVASLLVGIYLARQSARAADRPEDRPDALPAEGTGELGWFPSASIWPFGISAGAVLIANGLVFGIWLVLMGTVLMAACLVGYTLEGQGKA